MPPAATTRPPSEGSPILPAVLLVGRSVDLHAVLAAALEPLDVRLVEAASEDEALRHVRGEDFAAILVDVPPSGGLDGLGTARAIRSLERGRLTPLLLLSDADLEDARVPRGEGAGWVDVLRKPLHAEALRGRVGILLELFRARAEVRRQAEVIHQQARALTEASHRERMEGLLLRAPAAIAVTRGEDFVFEFVNPLYERVTGRPIRLGAPLSEALPEVMEQPEVLAALRGVMRTGQPFVARAFPVSLRRDPGGPIEEAFFDLVYQPTFDAQGRVEGLVSFAVEVTEATRGRRRAEVLAERLAQREEQLRLVADALPALISFIGRDERYQLVNRAYTEWFGLEREQVVGRQVREVVGEAAYSAVRPFIERALAGEAFTFERDVTYPKSGTRHVRASYLPHRDARGEVVGFVGLVQDITEEERARARSERLQDVTSALSRAATPADIAHVLVREATEGLGATSGLVFLRDGGMLRLLAAEGFSAEMRARVLEGYREVPLETPIPATDVVRSGEPQWLEGKDALLARYPQLASAQAASGNQAWATLPLPGPRGPIGSFALTFREARHVREEEKAFLRALAQQASMALERARLYDESTRTEALARAAAERMRLLSEGSRAFSAAPLEEAPLLDAICREVSRQFSEAAGVSLLSADGRFVVPRATYHPDPEVTALILRTMQQRPVPYGEGNLGRVVATGQPLLVSRVDPPVLLASMPVEYREFLERSPVRSFMVVALRVHGRVVGTMQASRHAKASVPFEPEDLALLSELADRAGLALGQAWLYQEARAAARVREDFLTVAAHELRTPLTSLKLQLEMVRRIAGADALDRARVPLDRVNGQVDRLAQLVESLLDVGRLAAGRLEVELGPVDVGALVRDVLGRMEPVLAQARCTPRVQVPDDGAWARADVARLDQVLVNLLSNAAKYGAGKPVDVQVWREDGHVVVRVRDEGIGIAPESLPRLFERFGRAVSGRHYAGLGLGLYITRQLVEAMGGQVRVESRLGEGSTFTVTLQAAPSGGEGAAGNGA